MQEGRSLQLIDGSISTRRRVLLASLLAALPIGSAKRAEAINLGETQVTLPDQIKWTAWTAGPPQSAEIATLYGGLDSQGPYVVLMKWYPGYMSAPIVMPPIDCVWSCRGHGG